MVENSLNPAVVFIGVEILCNLLKTRKTFPSKTALGSLKQKDAMAAAVYGPIPVKVIRSL